MNLESLRLSTIWDNLLNPFTNKEGIFDNNGKFGRLHNGSNHVNNPSIPPYYGEIPYSGRMVVLGYYGEIAIILFLKLQGTFAEIQSTKNNKNKMKTKLINRITITSLTLMIVFFCQNVSHH